MSDHEDHDHGDGSHGDDNHDDHHAHDEDAVSIAVVTVSSSRTLEEDPGGDVIEAALTDAGHDVTDRLLATDDRVAIAHAVTGALEAGADVVVTTGGTGLTADDVTVDATRPLFDREIPGFGELFRYVSFEEVGPMAMASRATAGVVADRLVFCLPGSENAARTGSEQLVAPAVGHLLGLVRR
ncbi:MogA/MoaB family molybdenum cofactor biosynthesis protein [Haloarcula salinisoli]|uniref:Molybdenum cofactor biosynthesis protein MoaB n=1 Tax=Haloarcula salinisoli TaxID=2487746 RepID=A0A8J7YB00_9EURY|nr:molybdenum cofactor biosynthesis protein B [Halomicroarcula salinisoli]MBX0285781.1 molybdenum cofactor biosynthesis protein MoaB [Halomicroarcula salinisoli]MBX0302730.1 molybdenum cofactor biosynthesis protein MoaB [Halomicroarcula salinisoli]